MAYVFFFPPLPLSVKTTPSAYGIMARGSQWWSTKWRKCLYLRSSLDSSSPLVTMTTMRRKSLVRYVMHIVLPYGVGWHDTKINHHPTYFFLGFSLFLRVPTKVWNFEIVPTPRETMFISDTQFALVGLQNAFRCWIWHLSLNFDTCGLYLTL